MSSPLRSVWYRARAGDLSLDVHRSSSAAGSSLHSLHSVEGCGSRVASERPHHSTCRQGLVSNVLSHVSRIFVHKKCECKTLMGCGSSHPFLVLGDPTRAHLRICVAPPYLLMNLNVFIRYCCYGLALVSWLGAAAELSAHAHREPGEPLQVRPCHVPLTGHPRRFLYRCVSRCHQLGLPREDGPVGQHGQRREKQVAQMPWSTS